jgi:uncharacterized protein YkwD
VYWTRTQRETRVARLARRVVGWLALALLTLAFALGSAAAVSAATPALSVRSASGPPGTQVTVEGDGFPDRTRVTLSWDGSSDGLPRPWANRNGSFSIRLTVPANAAPGAHTLRASAEGSQASTTFQVTSAGPSATATKPAATPTATSPAPTATRIPSATPVPPTATAQPSPTSVPPSASPTTVPATPTGTTSGAFQEQLLSRVNAARATAGVAPLTLNASLNRAAQDYAALMAATGCFAHDCPPEPNFARRAEAAGYTGWRTLGENIAYGQRTADEVHDAWMNSSGHRANILNPSFREFGAGLAYSASGRAYWVEEFGARP